MRIKNISQFQTSLKCCFVILTYFLCDKFFLHRTFSSMKFQALYEQKLFLYQSNVSIYRSPLKFVIPENVNDKQQQVGENMKNLNDLNSNCNTLNFLVNHSIDSNQLEPILTIFSNIIIHCICSFGYSYLQKFWFLAFIGSKKVYKILHY